MPSLRKLFQQSFGGHKGIPGKQGGSLPRGSGGADVAKKTSTGKDITVKKETYSWGDLRKVEFGYSSGRAVIHPENYDEMKKLNFGESMSFVDEQKKKWSVKRMSEDRWRIKATDAGTKFDGIFTME